jgi:hypothetical protein
MGEDLSSIFEILVMATDKLTKVPTKDKLDGKPLKS